MEPLFKIEKLNPNIESGVPGAQPLKSAPSEVSVDKVETTSDNYVPVLKVTRTETTLTKGDFKLQKGNAIVAINPFHSEVFGDVINGPHPQRTELRRTHDKQDGGNVVEGNNSQIEEKKAKTKIPVLNKFRQTADKIKVQRRSSKEDVNKEQNNQANVPQRVRRSSIPKLRKMKNETEETKTQNEIKNSDKSSTALKNNEENTKPEDEFEKLFEEIVTDPIDTQVAILPDSKVEPENLESSFEEIIHAYDEKKLEPFVVEQKRDNTTTWHSKIPLNRSQSDDVNVPKEISRRNSLKNSPFIERDKVIVKSINFSKPIDQPVNGKIIKNGENTTTTIRNNSETNGDTNETIEENMPNEPLDTGNIELIKEYEPEVENTNIILIHDNKNNDLNGGTGLYTNQNISQAVNQIETEIEPYVGVIGDIDTQVDLTKNEEKNEINRSEEDLTFFKGKVNRLISRLNSKDDSLHHIKNELNIDEIPKKKSVLSKVALFELKEPTKAVNPNTKDKKARMEIKKIITEDPIVCRKPIIIEEVLKTHVRTAEEGNDDNRTTPIVNEIDIQATERKLTDKPVAPEITKKYARASIEIIEKHVSNDNIQIELKTENKEANKIVCSKSEDSEIDKTDQKQTKPQFLSVENEPKEILLTSRYDELLTGKQNQHSDEPEESITKNRMRRLQSMTELNNQKLIRSKSVVDLELGETVKGKVQKMIQNFKSEKQEAAKKDVINVKERPRRKSVFEKIALFERKLTPVTMEDAASTENPQENGSPPQDGSTEKPQVNGSPPQDGSTVNANNNVPNAQDLKARIDELANAKKTYGTMNTMPFVTLSNGHKMPVLAVGTALLDPLLIKDIIGAAIDLGYRAIDTAYIYGNEQLVGEAIRAKIEDGTVKREDLFIMSKLWSTYHRPDLVEKACRDSLQTLGLDYFDLFMIHNPMSFKEGADPIPTIANVVQYSEHDFMDAWFAMERLVSKKLVNSIGLSNFNSQQLAKVYEKSHVKPVVNQVECHPYLSQERLTGFCDPFGIHIICFGALGSKGTPADFKTPGVSAVIDDPFVQVMASGMHISPARLLIRYQLERGHSVVVKSSTAEHLWDNLQALECKLSTGTVEALGVLNKNKRNFSFKGMGDTHKNYPFKIPF